MDSLEETFRIGREVGVPVVISHHKVIGAKNYGRSDETLEFIRKSMAKQPICLDCYPYAAGSTVLSMSRAENSARVIVTCERISDTDHAVRVPSPTRLVKFPGQR